MREILFRGKLVQSHIDHDKGDWVYGLLARQGLSWYISNFLGQPFAYEVISETIGQYTGITDKTGMKIFEGDILATPVDYLGVVMDIIEYKNGSFVCSNGSRSKPHLQNGRFSKIIGNIHDNPELLDGADNG